MSANVIALNRCSVKEICWKKNKVWRLSSLMVARRWPRSWRNSTPLTLMGPSVSNGNRMNVCVCWRSTYLSSFQVAAFSASPPAFVDVRWRYESATVSVTVTSHVRLFPRCHEMRVSPSLFRRCAKILAVPERLACLLSLALGVWCRWVDGVVWIDRCPAYTRDRAYLYYYYYYYFILFYLFFIFLAPASTKPAG